MYKNGIKRLIDILVSGLGIVVLSPVFLILYVLVRVKLGKPVGVLPGAFDLCPGAGGASQ